MSTVKMSECPRCVLAVDLMGLDGSDRASLLAWHRNNHGDEEN